MMAFAFVRKDRNPKKPSSITGAHTSGPSGEASVIPAPLQAEQRALARGSPPQTAQARKERSANIRRGNPYLKEVG